jgi:cytoskeletal protein CcmA (bactofilin family)
MAINQDQIEAPTVLVDVDSTLASIPEISATITETSIHNTTSENLGENREIDNYLQIDKNEKVHIQDLEASNDLYQSTAEFGLNHFPDKRPISKQLSDLNDQKLLNDIQNEKTRSYETDILLAQAINLEDEQREIADAQIRADITKEASERANIDAQLANTLAQYKYDMSQHITTRDLDVNGDANINIEVSDGDMHGGNLNIQTTLNVGYEGFDGAQTAEGKVIGDAKINHNLYVGHNLFVDRNASILGNISVNGNSTLNGNVIIDGYLDVKGSTTLEENVIANKNVNILNRLEVAGTTYLKSTLQVDGNTSIDGDVNIEGDTHFSSKVVIDGKTTLLGKVLVQDDNNSQNALADVIGTIKNALVKDFTQTYNPETGKLTSKLEFQNYHIGDPINRPTVETIEKTIDLDLEKYVLDIDDVFAKRIIVNGKKIYTDVVLTEDQLQTIDLPENNGQLTTPDGGVILRCLKVEYNTRGNTSTFEDGGDKVGDQKYYIYFEVNDIFRSVTNSILNMITLNTRTINLRDLAGNILWSFSSFAPGANNEDQDIIITELNGNDRLTLPQVTIR